MFSIVKYTQVLSTGKIVSEMNRYTTFNELLTDKRHLKVPQYRLPYTRRQQAQIGFQFFKCVTQPDFSGVC